MLNVIALPHRIVRLAPWGVVFCVLSAFLASCTSIDYHENFSPPRKDRAVVYFITDSGQGIWQVRIDGRRARKVMSSKQKERHGPVLIRAGTRNIAIQFMETAWPRQILSWKIPPVAGLSLRAIAQRTYEVRFKAARTMRGFHIWTWAIDRGTGKVVAGERPSEADLK
jgi:hypothetical protein